MNEEILLFIINDKIVYKLAEALKRIPHKQVTNHLKYFVNSPVVEYVKFTNEGYRYVVDETYETVSNELDINKVSLYIDIQKIYNVLPKRETINYDIMACILHIISRMKILPSNIILRQDFINESFTDRKKFIHALSQLDCSKLDNRTISPIPTKAAFCVICEYPVSAFEKVKMITNDE